MKSVTERLTAVPDDCDPTRPVYLEDNIRAIASIVVPLAAYHPPSALEPYRELRHTTWGEDDAPGYLNSPSAKVIAEAFAQLRRWFDID